MLGKNKNFNKLSGFTLIELLVAIAIIAILSSVAILSLSGARQKAQDTSYLSAIRDLQINLEAYKSVNGKYPNSGSGANYIASDFLPFIKKLPTGLAGATGGYIYSVDSDNKTYCLYLNDLIFKPETQPDMKCANRAHSWYACRGTNTDNLNTCKTTTP